jgi:flagellar biosynthesis anti-sigma factor FlgM
MRVDAPSSFPENLQPQKVTGSRSPAQRDRPVAVDSNQDQAQLAVDGSRVQQLKDTLSGVPEVRQERVEALRQAVGNGSYQVSDQQLSDAIGSALLSGHLRLA